VFDPVTCWWLRPTSQTQMPVGADWGEQSEWATLTTPGLAIHRIQHQEGPHQHCLQHLEWEITQPLQKMSQHTLKLLADTPSLLPTYFTLLNNKLLAMLIRNDFFNAICAKKQVLLVSFTNITIKFSILIDSLRLLFFRVDVLATTKDEFNNQRLFSSLT